MSPAKSKELKIGILGGGQLARLLLQSAQTKHFQVHVLSEHTEDPAAQISTHWHKGSGKKLEDLIPFLKTVDMLTFESEFFDTQLIEQALMAVRKTNLQCFPSLKTLALLQDRRSQKETLSTYKIPTAPFSPVNSVPELEGTWKLFDGPFVLKKAQGGYDGNGTWYVNSVADIQTHQMKWQGPYLAEQKIQFHRELAIIAFRNLQGQTTFFPLVETVQKNSRCDYVAGPLKHPEIDAMKEGLARMMEGIDYVGALGVEFFETPQGLLVNELAPRVHNTGHYSTEGLKYSQFDFHWLAGLGKPFPENPLVAPSFVMTNLIGESTHPFNIPDALNGKLHWYDKKENRAGRKMGHINYIGPDKHQLLERALIERKGISK